MKKKILAAILASTMTLTAAASASAVVIGPDENGDPNPNSGNTQVALTVDPTYTITIPELVTLQKSGDNYTQTTQITADNVMLEENEKITVTMNSDYTMTSGSTELSYTVTAGNALITNNTTAVAEFTTSTAAQSQEVVFTAADPEYAGSYTDTVTFNVSAPQTVGTTGTIDPWQPGNGGGESVEIS